MEAAPYDFRWKDKLHVYCNHANKVLGGGMFSSGFVQEEQLLLKTTLLFPLHIIHGTRFDPTNIMSSNLEIQPLLIKTNLIIHQDMSLGLYGESGINTINSNPTILNKFYQPHRTMPPIYILSKAMPILQPGETYTNKVFSNMKLIRWIFLSALHSYCLAIAQLKNDPGVETIHIHEGNWGCGVYNHNVNTIYVLVHLAIRVACSLFGLNLKPVIFHYHTFDLETMHSLEPGIKLLDQLSNIPIDLCLKIIDSKHENGDPIWCMKL